jgi:hypothetical protein
MAEHPYRKGPRRDGYGPNRPTQGLRHRDGWPVLPKKWLRVTQEEQDAYTRVWAEYDRMGTWVPKSSRAQ